VIQKLSQSLAEKDDEIKQLSDLNEKYQEKIRIIKNQNDENIKLAL
jgi:hypothetical protein